MNDEIIKTVKWSDAKELLVALASENFGSVDKQPADFNEFILAYPTVSPKRIAALLREVITDEELADVTTETLSAENDCLFSASESTSLEIVHRYLKTLNEGGKIRSLWGFLDTEKKAVIHFVNRGGWFAEAFFSCPDDFSVIHMLKTENNSFLFIPVTFTSDLNKLLSADSLTGNFCLQSYLPHITGDFLSKGGKYSPHEKHNRGAKSPHNGKNKKGKNNGKSRTNRHDRGDLL